MWIRIKLLQLPIGKHIRISREFTNSWVLPAITIVSSLTLLRWLLQLVTCCLIIMLQEGFGLSSSPGLHGRRAGRDVILPVV